MHGILLGVTKTLLHRWIDNEHKGERFYIGNERELIDQCLCNIKPPDYVKRVPRGLQWLGRWKASEFRSWLLFYGIPCLWGILPSCYLNHFALLTEGIFIFLSAKLSEDSIKRAETVLQAFFEQLEPLYGISTNFYSICL
ncbi:uncharacterized protein LOC134195459 [Corticium candelabrum]|uniref:uncharacterized protein LOC134195459 n=1 Tax=Corticium candelabrum TaxID=121492 RepID=UPI002E26491C|nr:uncharacterized protein LOC134195459 [Corticium candelabrum]